jgi:3-isopropylmalate/(R)-2-methylmalate dehydratase small subunit
VWRFYRTSITIGLPLIETDLPVREGDRLRVDFEKGTVTNLTTKKSAKFPPYADFLQGLMDKGGLIPYAKMMIGEERRGKR